MRGQKSQISNLRYYDLGGQFCATAAIPENIPTCPGGNCDPSPNSLGQNLFRKPTYRLIGPEKVRGTPRRRSTVKTETSTEGAPHFKWSEWAKIWFFKEDLIQRIRWGVRNFKFQILGIMTLGVDFAQMPPYLKIYQHVQEGIVTPHQILWVKTSLENPLTGW